jgi:biopolymer transport protein TolR
MSMGGNNDGLMSEINVTPLVDVMLVLLIIFMVTAPMMMQGVDVTLPETTSKPLAAEKEHIVLTIAPSSQVYINEVQVPIEVIAITLSRILQEKPEKEAYLRADKSIPYGTVVRVMAEVKAAGIHKLGMVTVPLNNNLAKN